MEKVPAWQASDGKAFFNRGECARHEAGLDVWAWVEVAGVNPESGGERAVTAETLVENAAAVIAMLKRVIPPKAKEAPHA